MQADARRTRLLDLVRSRGFASLPELAQELEVSESTVRRDVELLEEAGTARRTHGGVFYTGPSPNLPHFELRHEMQWSKKRQIAKAAAQLIEDGDTVILDGGSTTYELAQMLVGRTLQIVTNSLPVANLFMASPTTELILLGGYVHNATGVSLGPYANEMISRLSARRAVLSVAGITEQGLYNSNLLLVETERAMMKAGGEVIIVADSTKFGRQSLAQMCELSEVDKLVVDHEISEAWQSRVQNAGVDLIVAPAEMAIIDRPISHKVS
ncbi:DeoR/GlpR family DNA-binding transcription regulator [Bremerella sp. T1]|uniref:DeoR/GlpR family DNA-binding transcription regulator n=1 Tax=Bremerella sp. TYQ1 TaxID=3119568 RepID=UPI001CCDE982|nr:DeoR/GlpR family DNA-binding transcription regulator [Bremerella volcania]UBM36167.1 DeoR/GlpR family DNA-binding transcription regulator [Bremerella volcania]